MIDEIGNESGKSPIITTILSEEFVCLFFHLNKSMEERITLNKLNNGIVACEKRCTNIVSNICLA